MSSIEDSIESRLAATRRMRGISAAELASRAGIGRQAVYAIEAGTYMPNTAVALRLARALDIKVEDLFVLKGATEHLPVQRATVLPDSDPLRAGQPVQLCRVDRQLVASAPSPVPWYLPPADAVAAGAGRVRLLHEGDDPSRRILVAGCDPGISVLARRLQRAGVELVLAHRNSSQSLNLLRRGCIHIAGSHLRDETSGESNLPAIRRVFPKSAVAVFAFAVWEEGLVVARRNPKHIRGVEDLARQDVAVVNREPGAGSRKLLDSWLHRSGISPAAVRGYDDVVQGHIPAAWNVRTNRADACVATRAAACVLGLDFIPLVSERYDLVIRRRHLRHPGVALLLDALNRSGFRRELENVGGYDASMAGRRLL